MKNKNKRFNVVGRTYFTNDKYLPHTNNNAYKDVNIVSLEYDSNYNFLGVRLTKQKTRNTTKLQHHTYKGFKHFVEKEDYFGNPIKEGKYFKENSSKFDLSSKQIDFIKDIVFNHSKQSQRNKKILNDFRNGKFSNKKSRN